ncbi:MAG: DHH family phosphoesterase, partial [Chitinispirillaceae bacterium]|nr:DHH family phosphoesterase [Chitinispirillaceae bacterium]
MSGFPCARERITVRELDETMVSRLASQLNVTHSAARILACRNLIDPDVCTKFFAPALRDLHDPFLFSDMDRAVVRILDAVAQNERIAVFGDYDVDGVSGTALLVRVLTALGVRCDYYLPHRLTEGYGVSESGVRRIAENGARLMITVDCGVTAVREIAGALRSGIDCIVTDHHEPKDTLPPAYAMLDPKIPSCSYPDKDLAGVGVVFKLCQ